MHSRGEDQGDKMIKVGGSHDYGTWTVAESSTLDEADLIIYLGFSACF